MNKLTTFLAPLFVGQSTRAQLLGIGVPGRPTGQRADLIVLDDFEDAPTLDQRTDDAECALNAYQAVAGSTGSDRADIVELIADLLHLLDDLHLEPGESIKLHSATLSEALTEYRRDAITN